MTTPIPYDDLRPDLWVTIRDGHTLGEPRAFAPGAELIWDLHRRYQDRPPVRPGVPLRVLEVDIPYLYVAVLGRNGELEGPAIIDLRRFPVVELASRVADAIAAFANERTEASDARRREEIESKAIWRAEGELARRRTLGIPVDDESEEPITSPPGRRRRSDRRTAGSNGRGRDGDAT